MFGQGIPDAAFPSISSMLDEFPRLSVADNALLCGDPDLGSIVERTKRDTAPGPDGLPHSFYRVFWSALRQYFVRLVCYLFSTPE